MKLIYTIILIAFFSLTINAQSPYFHWAKKTGGIGNDKPTAIGIDYDPGDNEFFLDEVEGWGSFIQKLDSNGNFVWAKQIFGLEWNSSQVNIYDIVFSNNFIYISGLFDNTADFDPSEAEFVLDGTQFDIFVLKLDLDGNFIWAKQIGSGGGDFLRSFVIDSNENIYLSGYIGGSDFDYDPGINEYTLPTNNSERIFFLKLDQNGEFQWVERLPYENNSTLPSLSIDSNNDYIYVKTYDDEVDQTFNGTAYSTKTIINKFDTEGELLWNKDFFGTSDIFNVSNVIDNIGNVYTIGSYKGEMYFENGDVLASNGNFDIFISKLDSEGNSLWALGMGGDMSDRGWSIATDSNGNVYAVGSFEDTADFESGTGGQFLFSEGGKDIFILKLDSNGNILLLEKISGTNEANIDDEEAEHIIIDESDNIYISGYFQGNADFDLGANSTFLNSFGGNDIFILKMRQEELVGLEGEINIELLNVFPNPNNGNFSLNFEKVYNYIELNVFDIQGNIVYTSSFNNSSNVHLNLELPPGVYASKVITDKKMMFTKIIIK